MIRIIPIILLCFFIISCSKTKELNKRYCTDFNLAVVDSLEKEHSEVCCVVDKSLYMMYVTDGSCAECIDHFIEFVKNKNENKKISVVPCIYIVNAEDFVLLDYYMAKNNLSDFMKTDLLIKSSSNTFHRIEPESYSGNQLLIISKKESVKIVSVNLNPFKDEYITSDFEKLINSMWN